MGWSELHGAAGDAVCCCSTYLLLTTQNLHFLIQPNTHSTLNQDPDQVRILINAGVNINEQDAMGHTPLHVAAGSEEPGSGRFVCSADLGEMGKQHLTSNSCTGAVVAILCENGASVEIQANLSRETALHRAANEGQERSCALAC